MPRIWRSQCGLESTMFSIFLKDILPIIETSAPIIASSLLGPGAGFAFKLIANAFGLDPKMADESSVKNAISSNTNAPDILQQLERDFGFLFDLKTPLAFKMPLKAEVNVKLEWSETSQQQ